MSRKCPVTGKGPMYGNNVSHSMRHTRRRWDVNLQTTTIMINGKMQKVKLSTNALRTLRKNAKANAAKVATTATVEEAKAE
ncbi:MAG: 50S ribosomal protein L28 [Bacilli bacterium]